jgi:hypothetical protein
MTWTMTTSEERDQEELKLVTGIAQKLWWGWVPQTALKRWGIPFDQRHEPMSQEEREWLRRH